MVTSLMQDEWQRVLETDFICTVMSKDMCKTFIQQTFDVDSASADQQRVQSACHQLVATSPKYIEGWTWSNASLQGSNWAFLWLAANELLGSKWSIKDTTQLPDKPLPTMTTLFASKDLVFQSKTTRSGVYLVRKERTSTAKKFNPFNWTTSLDPKNSATYITIKLPEAISNDVAPVIKTFKDVVTQLASLDSSLVVYPFP